MLLPPERAAGQTLSPFFFLDLMMSANNQSYSQLLLRTGWNGSGNVNPISDMRISFLRLSSVHLPSRSEDPPPWILKQAGLESSGQRLISSIGKTKRIAFFFRPKKNIFNIFRFFEKYCSRPTKKNAILLVFQY